VCEQDKKRQKTVAAERKKTYVTSAVAGSLSVELAGTEVDVRGAVAVHPRLGLEAVGAGIAEIGARGGDDLGDNLGGFEKGEHLKRNNSMSQ